MLTLPKKTSNETNTTNTTEVYSKDFLFFCPFKSPLSIFHKEKFVWLNRPFNSINEAYWWAISNDQRDVRVFDHLDDTDKMVPCPDKTELIFLELYTEKKLQCTSFREILLTAGKRRFAAGSIFETTWSTGLALDDPRNKSPHNWIGSNRLGDILNKVA